jgi:ribose transport system ATP-binding protein
VKVASDIDTALVSIRGLSKTFPGQRALDSVDLSLHRGEIHALVGQNGSGKSTLIKVLAGYHRADPGSRVLIQGRDAESDRHGTTHSGNAEMLRFIHQDLGLVESMSVVDNLALGRGYQTGFAHHIVWEAERQRAMEAFERLGVSMDLDVPVGSLSPAERTIVAIARALDGWETDSGVLVLDEATASLAAAEVDALFRVVREVAARGAAVLFVSHRLDEVLALCDSVTVLRDGRVVFTGPVEGTDRAKLVDLITGSEFEELKGLEAPPDRFSGPPLLSVTELSGAVLSDMSFQVRPGETVGVTGLAGSGVGEVCRLLFGADVRTGGSVRVDGEDLKAGDIRAAIQRKVVLVPSDRLRDGCQPSDLVRPNITLPSLRMLWKHGRISRAGERNDALHWAKAVELRPLDTEAEVSSLSGGNQQKVVLAKWLRLEPRVLLLDEPVKGVDVGAKASIFGLLRKSVAAGTAIVMCSSEAADLIAMCDRVIVLKDGKASATLQGEQLTERQISRATLGSGVSVNITGDGNYVDKDG